MSRAHPLRVAHYLRHILVAIGNIQEYTAGMDRDAFLADRKASDAEIHNLKVVGGACNNLAKHHPDFAQNNTTVPWGLPTRCAML